MSETQHPRRRLRSTGAVLAGIVVGAALSLGADEALHRTGTYPPWGLPMSGVLYLLATSYRIPFNIAGSYVMAWLAPDRPMQHALAGGVLGLALSIVGAAVTWNRNLGPHWYPITVAAIALPCAWAGGKIRLVQLHASS
ncbi:MAG TPA: hypothetical protein VJO53_04650 [Candidatus Acidoferrales bacterium]|nr:hypothetical protein [Candidatus Acidoferrales bacterium]